MTKAKTEGVQRSSADRNGGPYKRGLWTAAEDKILVDYVMVHGMGHWNLIAKRTGLKRCGKSCRLRWMNYLSPTVKKDRFSEEEEDLIIRLHKLLGNRWSLIAKRVPGRTDNQIKNYWNTHLSKKLGAGKQNSPVLKTTKSSDSTTISSGATYGNTGPKPAKESQSSNYIEKDLDSFAEEDCIKSIWDFDHEFIELSMTELLHGYTNHHHLSWPHS